MNNQTCFNGFTQTDFVSKQHAWRDTFTNFMSDIELMFNNIDARAHQAFERMTSKRRLHTQNVLAQLVPITALNTTSEQALKRLGQRNISSQTSFHNAALVLIDTIFEHAHHFFDRGYGIGFTGLVRNAIAFFEHHPR